jgi:hypothetical protein
LRSLATGLITTDLAQWAPWDGADRISTGPQGAWDARSVCCASLLEHEGRLLLWYSARGGREDLWRIGLAVSADGLHFEKQPGPVLSEGGPDEFDVQGVSQPEVVYDAPRKLYRMWYTAHGFLGVTSIGYAVSTDGVTWSK